MPPAPDLWAGPTEGAGFDPFAVLGVAPELARDDAREAYLRLAKTYHPDRYASADLPREVRDYLAVMVRRINAAHDTVADEDAEEGGQAGADLHQGRARRREGWLRLRPVALMLPALRAVASIWAARASSMPSRSASSRQELMLLLGVAAS